MVLDGQWTASLTGFSIQYVQKILGTVELNMRPRYESATAITVKYVGLPTIPTTIIADIPSQQLIRGIYTI